MPSPPACNLLAMVGLSMVCTALGCHLGVSDVVRRSPDVGGGMGGSSGQDAQNANPGARDAVLLSSPPVDGHEAITDAFTMGDSAAETGAATDAPPGIVPDTAEALRDAISVSKVTATCLQDGHAFCDGFEDGEDRWTVTNGSWSLSEVSDGSETNMVFGPTAKTASIAFVPTAAWQDMTVEARVMVTSFDQASSTNRVVLYARYQDTMHFYAVAVRGDGKLGLRRNGTAFGSMANVSVADNEWHRLKLSVSGPADDVVVEGSLDGTLLVAATDTSGSMSSDVGTVGLGVYGGALALFDDIKVSSP
jgi:hypothetical protein